MSAFQVAFEALRKTVGDVEADRLLAGVETEKVGEAASWLHSVGEREAAYLLRTCDIAAEDPTKATRMQDAQETIADLRRAGA
ncbi:hypothetical protein AB0D56_09680 [Streptomyces sp. NPDC048209]|uniref:hypothetical protein n=1 Tax=Streptomyces sp. NPDC048209 TaxID=3156689 RepID=UPI0034412FCA